MGAGISSHISQVKAEQENCADDAANIRTRLLAEQTELETADERVQETVLQRAQMTASIGEKEEEYKKARKEVAALKSSTNPLVKQEREIDTNISNRTKEILNQEKLIKKLKAEVESLKSELKKHKEEERQFETAAKKITGAEIVPERTVKQLNAKIVQLQKKIKNKQENEDIAVFLNYFQELKERYVDMKRQIEKLENLLERIE